MDRAQVFTVDTGLPRDDNQADDQPGEILKQFRSFILEFRLDNNFIYRYGSPSRADPREYDPREYSLELGLKAGIALY